MLHEDLQTWCNSDTFDRCHLMVWTLLYCNIIASFGRWIKGCFWTGHIEGYIMILSSNCYLVSAYLICSVSISNNSICPDNDSMNCLLFHASSNSTVADERSFNLFMHQLICCKAGTLVIRPSFCAVNMSQFLILVEVSNDTWKRRPRGWKKKPTWNELSYILHDTIPVSF